MRFLLSLSRLRAIPVTIPSYATIASKHQSKPKTQSQPDYALGDGLDKWRQADLLQRKNDLYREAEKEFAHRDLDAVHRGIQAIRRDFPFSLHLANIILKIYIMLNDTGGIKGILGEIKDQGLAPNVYTYNLLISYYRNSGKVEEALAVYERMKGTSGVIPNTGTYTTLIAMLNRHKLHSLAEALYKEALASCPDQLDLHLFNAMMSSYFDSGRPQEAHQVVNQMLAAGIRPNHITYKIMLVELLTQRKLAEAHRLYDQHLRDCPEMEPHELGDIAARFLGVGDTSKGLEVYDMTMKRHGRTTPFAHGVACHVFCKEAMVDRIERIHQLSLANKHVLAKTCHPLLAFYMERARKVDGAADAYAGKLEAVYMAAVRSNLTISPAVEGPVLASIQRRAQSKSK